MAKEIERKFLVKDFPIDLIRKGEAHRITQGYIIKEDNKELRVRQKGHNYYLTEKSGDGLAREETELPISEEVYDLLWSYTEGRQIKKIRYTFEYQNHTLELDDFGGPLEPLTILEVEFNSEDEAKDFTPPEFAEEEITTDNRFKNINLAIHGKPD